MNYVTFTVGALGFSRIAFFGYRVKVMLYH